MLGFFSRRIILPCKNVFLNSQPLFKSPFIQPKLISNTQLCQNRFMANYRHKKMIKMAKGYRGRANRCFTVAKQRVEKALQYQYRDRKVNLKTKWL